MFILVAGTRRLRKVFNLPYEGDAVAWSFWNSFTITSAFMGGGYGVQHSFGSSFEHILNQEGTHIQQELGNVLVNFVEKFPLQSEDIIKQYVSKHFYREKVFDDLSTDPKHVWRCKNFFRDVASASQRTSQSSSYSENTDLQPKPFTVDNPISAISGVQKRDRFSKKESTDIDTVTDPFEWNVPQREEDVEDAASSAMSRRRHKRSHKRANRRLMSRREASTNMQHALADKGMASI
ncbi:uncharacterized protein LOC141676782 isoform X2 [Apium graveolens]|uniref:uncharacterized protein LOC141676782 isoform X2 n=1 Tax=Apium graveolens TaxID=4045 RepID=UPI003D797F25